MKNTRGFFWLKAPLKPEKCHIPPNSSSYINGVVCPTFVPFPNPLEKTRNSFYQTLFFANWGWEWRAGCQMSVVLTGGPKDYDLALTCFQMVDSTRLEGKVESTGYDPETGNIYIQVEVGLVKLH